MTTVLSGHDGWVNGVALLEVDGTALLATAGEDGEVLLHDLDRQTATRMIGHVGAVNAVVAVDFAGGALVASGGVMQGTRSSQGLENLRRSS
ncbi:WD40 repeat domain-containing protein [Umezawaea endophytica]|uniref:WD40 domain-containing protein n=1 Tax=Umezawaea endophytica TaxID=1654476 RepID=A0A9X3AJ07_9PSEU|nr:WD40 repeat domain-containing protein [Umezawaea endophytica]MCS7483812.1 WD40 domain-containing protein [Umezawaea endophytica]